MRWSEIQIVLSGVSAAANRNFVVVRGEFGNWHRGVREVKQPRLRWSVAVPMWLTVQTVTAVAEKLKEARSRRIAVVVRILGCSWNRLAADLQINMIEMRE